MRFFIQTKISVINNNFLEKLFFWKVTRIVLKALYHKLILCISQNIRLKIKVSPRIIQKLPPKITFFLLLNKGFSIKEGMKTKWLWFEGKLVEINRYLMFNFFIKMCTTLHSISSINRDSLLELGSHPQDSYDVLLKSWVVDSIMIYNMLWTLLRMNNVMSH